MAKQSNLVSVIVPTYNRKDLLLETIDSVYDQTYDNWELIIADDGSNDGTAELVTKMNDARIRYAYQTNQGCASALNHGTQLAQGNYLVYLGSDDLLFPNALLDHIGFLEMHPEYGASYGEGFLFSASMAQGEKLSAFRRIIPFKNDLENMIIFSFFIIQAAMFKRSWLDKLEGPFDEKMLGAEDWDMLIRLAGEGCRFGELDTFTCKYRVHANNKSSPHSSLSEKRRQALIHNRFKVMRAPWFRSISTDAKYQFFYGILTNYLRGETRLHEEVFQSEQFVSLPKRQQANLLYYTAVENILVDKEPGLARRRLVQALRRNPIHSKALMGLLLCQYRGEPFRHLVELRRSIGKTEPSEPTIPFEMPTKLDTV